MKLNNTLRNFLLLSGSIMLTLSAAKADTLYWDGGTVDIGTDGNGVSLGTAGNWNTTLLNWDAGASPHVAWDNTNTLPNPADTAFFGGTGASVTLTAPITVGGLGFSSNSGYIINAGAQGLTFGGATNQVRMINVSGTTSAATISGTVTGSGNVVLTSVARDVASTLTFNGTSAGGWSGATTINPSATLSLAASNQALLNTSGITLNGGNILLTNTATGSENTINRVRDTAAITSYGSGSISIANTSTAGRQYSETIGSITHNNGQLNVGFTTIQNGTAPSNQTLMVGGLTNNGTTSTIAINGGGSGAGAIHGNSFIRVNGITTSTAANEIIGPWITAGTGSVAQSDWAVYVSDGVSGRIMSRGIAGSAQTTWTSSSATGNYTAANANPLTSTANNRLTADRFVNTLRATFSESNAASHTMTAATDTITFAGHALTDGDVVAFRGAGGLTDTRPYYVINSVAGTSFQLSLTPGGSLLDLTSDTEGFIATGLNLNGNTLGMNGYITGTTGTAAIGGGSASTITLPTATSGNLYLHGANNIWIDPSIEDNGAGVLTLVKAGTNTVTLSGANTYTGGTVINGGTLAIGSVSNLGGAGASLTFGGTGTLAPSAALNFSTGTLTVDEGAFGTITGNGATSFQTTTGTGTLRYTSAASSGSLNLGDASDFDGNLEFRLTGNANYGQGASVIQFSSLGDGVGSVLQVGGGQSDSSTPGQRATITLTGGSAPLVFDNRVVELLPRINSNHTVNTTALQNNNSSAANTWVINTDLSVQITDARFFELSGSNTGNNAFNGVISNGNLGGSLSFRKDGAGKWILGNTANSYTGSTNVVAGTLEVKTLADGGVASSIGASSNAAGNLLLANGTTLRYSGAGDSTDRNFTLNVATAGHGATLDASGSDAISFTNTASPAYGTTNQTRTLTLRGTNTDANTLAANIDNNGTGLVSIVKTDAGTWVLSGANTYDGTTTVTAGTLMINGNSSTATGAVTVAATGTIGGIGTVGGDTALNGTLSPGQSPGTLTFANDLNVNNGSTYLYEAGDLTIVDGTLDLNDNWTLALGSGFQDGGSVILFEYFGLAASPDLVPTFDLTGLGFSPGGALTLIDTGTSIVLNGVSVIPEPGAALLGSLGFLLIFRRRR